MAERPGLFRPEALAQHRKREFGTPVFGQSPLTTAFVVMASSLVCLAIGLLAFTHYRESLPARGVLVSSEGLHKVVAPANGTVSQIAVVAGQDVIPGQVLATLDRFTFDAGGRNIEQQRIGQLQQQQALLRQEQSLRDRATLQEQEQLRRTLRELEQTASLLAVEADLARQQWRLKQAGLEALRELQRGGAVTRRQLEQAEVEQLEQQARIQAVEQRRQTAAMQYHAQQAQQDALGLRAKQEEVRATRELQQLQFAIDDIHAQSRMTIVSEAAGEVASIAVEPGQSVRAGQPVFYLETAPESIEAELFVPSRIVGQLYPGQELLLSYDAFDYQFYGRYMATVTDIDRASLDPREHLLPVPGIQEPVFRVKAQLAQAWVEGPDIFRLQSGLLFTADIVTAEMSLLEYLLKPVLRLRARLA